ncbi:toxin [Spirochaeta dissipatitropha]
MAFYWNEEKNNQLKEERSISFERIVVAIEEDHLIDAIENPNKEKYKNQLILIVDIDGYAVCVPCVLQENGDYFLKTLFPSRKYTKKYNLGGKNE